MLINIYIYIYKGYVSFEYYWIFWEELNYKIEKKEIVQKEFENVSYIINFNIENFNKEYLQKYNSKIESDFNFKTKKNLQIVTA